MSARAFVHALRLRALAFVASAAAWAAAGITVLAVLFAAVPHGTPRIGGTSSESAARAPAERRAPPALRGQAARIQAVAREVRSPSASAERPAARASGRGAAPDAAAPPDVAPTAPPAGASVGRATDHRLDGAPDAAPRARHECLRSRIVCSPLEARAPPLG